jgi:hypothetical protein
VIHRAGRDLFLSELCLILCNNFESIEDASESGLRSNSLDWVLVEQVIDPRDLGDLGLDLGLAGPKQF